MFLQFWTLRGSALLNVLNILAAGGIITDVYEEVCRKDLIWEITWFHRFLSQLSNSSWLTVQTAVITCIPSKSSFCHTVWLIKTIANLCITLYWGAFAKPFMQWKSNKYYIFSVCVCSLRYQACNAHAPCYVVICGLSGCTVMFHVTS